MSFYIFVVDKGVSLAPTYSSIMMKNSDLRSSLGIERWLSCFIFSERLILVVNKSRLRHWTFKRSFDFFEKRESLRRRALLNDLLIFEWRGELFRRWTLNGFK